MIVGYWPYNNIIISNYIVFVDYEKVKYHIWFFQRKVSNDLEANTSSATLPTTNVEENPDVSIEENLNILIEENPDEPIEKNLDVPIEQNSQKKFQKVDMSLLQLELDPGLRRQLYTYHVDQRDEIWRRYI